MFSEWLRATLEQMSLSQADLARQSGLTPGAISHVINGTRKPGIAFCRAISKPLGLPSAYILRVAGYGLDEMKRDAQIDMLDFQFLQLSEQDRKEVVEFVRMKLRLAKK